MEQRPKFGTIERWTELTGVSRTATYGLLTDGSLTAVKIGCRTLINIEQGLAWLAAQPRAQIRCGRPRKQTVAADKGVVVP